MNSFEKSESFNEYLKNLSLNICGKYKSKIWQIENENNSDNENKIKNILETLKNHLAFELNCSPSEFDIEDKNKNKNEDSIYSLLSGWFSSSDPKIDTEKKKQ